MSCQVYLSVRNGAWCVPRVGDKGLPRDLSVFTRFTAFVTGLMPSRIVSSRLQKAANARFDHALYGLQPNHDITANMVVVNDDLPRSIISGSVQVRADIAHLTSSGVQFTDGTFVDDIDAIICATGKQPRVHDDNVTQIDVLKLMYNVHDCSYSEMKDPILL